MPDELPPPNIFAGLPRSYAGALLIDPPWLDKTWSPKGRGKSVDRYYQPRTLEWHMALPITSLCKPDCSLTMWFPQAMTDQALILMAAWGFIYKTQGAWAKQSKTGRKWQFGTGRILRSAAEFYLIGTRGNPQRQSRSIRNLIVAPVREHSRKPERIYEDIEELWLGPYVELFARYPRDGWLQWGDQLRSDAGGQPRTRQHKGGEHVPAPA
jgi:N6-adenosine-specific RNA methylase IME4